MRSWQALAAVLPLQLVSVLLDPFCAPGTLGFDEVAGRVIFALKSATQIAWIQMRLSCLCKMRFFLLIVDSSCEFQECGLSGPVSSECLFFNALRWVFLVHRTL